MVDAFGSQRNNVKPPERGVFSLDHDQECKESMTVYLSCLQKNKADHIHCRNFAQEYLSCRMDKGLMRPENFKDLGFQSSEDEKAMTSDINKPVKDGDAKTTIIAKRIDRSVLTEDSKEMKGWVAGTSVKTYNKWKFW